MAAAHDSTSSAAPREGQATHSARDESRRRWLADEFLFCVASSTYRAEELEASIEAAREQLDGVRAADPSRERVSGGYSDPDAIANRIQAVSAMEGRLEAARRREAAMLRLFDEVSAELSPEAAAHASLTIREHALGLRSTYTENVSRMREARERRSVESLLAARALEDRTRRELARLLERRGFSHASDLHGEVLL